MSFLISISGFYISSVCMTNIQYFFIKMSYRCKFIEKSLYY